jgi:organic hydroperoxide reductase OsmC/OhrA
MWRCRPAALVQQPHQVCPYSNATRNGIDVKLTVA